MIRYIKKKIESEQVTISAGTKGLSLLRGPAEIRYETKI